MHEAAVGTATPVGAACRLDRASAYVIGTAYARNRKQTTKMCALICDMMACKQFP